MAPFFPYRFMAIIRSSWVMKPWALVSMRSKLRYTPGMPVLAYSLLSLPSPLVSAA